MIVADNISMPSSQYVGNRRVSQVILNPSNVRTLKRCLHEEEVNEKVVILLVQNSKRATLSPEEAQEYSRPAIFTPPAPGKLYLLI